MSTSSYWSAVADVGQRQRGDAFVRHDSVQKHAFLYEAEGSSGQVWVYEALNASYPIRHTQRSISGFVLRRRANLNTLGLAGRDTGWIYGDFLDAYTGFGGQSAVGHPFDNGGSFLVHRWTTATESGFAQDFRSGTLGQGVLMHGDGRAGAFLVHGSIYWTYMQMGGPGSYLGWPTSNEFDYSNGCFTTRRQNYVGGYIAQDCDGAWRAH